MSTTQTERPRAIYALGHTPEEYERLRMQAPRVGGRDRAAAGPGGPRAGRELPGRRLRARRDHARDG